MVKLTQRFKAAINSFKSPDIPYGVEIELNANGQPSSFFMPLSWSSRTDMATVSVPDLVNAYNKCAPVASIINKKIKAHLNRKWYITDINGEVAKGSTVTSVTKLLEQPNPIQDAYRFEGQAKAYIQLFGRCFIYAPRLIIGRPDSVKFMWVIPNWFIEPVYTGKFYNQSEASEILSHYKLNIAGDTSRLEREDIIQINDIGINTDAFLSSASRLSSLTDQVNTIIAAYESNKELIVNHGAMGIISPNSGTDSTGITPAWTPKEKDQVYTELYQRHGITKGKFNLIVSTKPLQFQAVALPVKDLMLMESIGESIRQIAESYDMPKMLLGFDKGTTYSNLQEAKKSLYQDAIIPEADTYCSAITKHLGLDKQGLFYRAFYDHLEVFQSAKLDVAQALKAFNEAKQIEFTNGIITADEWKEAINNFTA